MNTVVCFSANSGNNALRAAIVAHGPYFEELGYEFAEVDLARGDAMARLDSLLRAGNIAFVYSPMGAGQDLEVEHDGRKKSLWEAARIPFLSLIGDIPAYYFERHCPSTAWHALLYFFPDHLAVRKRFPDTPGIRATVPPIPFDYHQKEDLDFRAKEKGRLLFLKNGNDPEKLVTQWREALAPTTFLMLVDLASSLASAIATDPSPDLDQHVTKVFHSRGIDVSQVPRLRLLFIAQVDDYLRRIKSTMMGRVLADFPIDIVGDNWEHVNVSGKRARYSSGLEYTRTGHAIRESLGVIDMSPNTELAPHDRAMRAFGNFTLCLTNEQRFFREGFADPDGFLFRFDEDHLRSRVEALLSNPKRTVEMGVHASSTFRSTRRPGDFAEFAVAIAEATRAACQAPSGQLPPYFVYPTTLPDLG